MTTDATVAWPPAPGQEAELSAIALRRHAGCSSPPSLVALQDSHPRAGDPELVFEDLLDEPFLALPDGAGPLRDYWLAIDQRRGEPPTIGAIITSPDETYEALVDGRGICLLAHGNAPSLMRGGVVTRPVRGVPSCKLALAWRRAIRTPLFAPTPTRRPRS